ncbi:hypothetical protein TVAG_249780 [Trichomonas vaginalis G3]|uniref:Uncharacterized protein n=1 Tax=Trichomonas vaginalis (strain ATCC PRA-98 / G3) TaxID=412133 RepID=A2DCI1_TRIV3|nr:armadillo (ARM) repeat-containing protein family [Trichomonas vaginalis G3]EAY21918.1 hypothetical protein TVAG_249780 [Trichomonas vaginalis G3]KAI5487608.1 armadillo (ARM) repeat-containing protein family [Trichomonas vaginalis G3]|eukprot:XP_001582904.1 hypothetical protein [Trichomonas vaginalis G3]
MECSFLYFIKFLASGNQEYINNAHDILDNEKSNGVLEQEILQLLTSNELEDREIFILLSISNNYNVYIPIGAILDMFSRNSQLINSEISKLLAKYITSDASLISQFLQISNDFISDKLNTLSLIEFDKIYSEEIQLFLISIIEGNYSLDCKIQAAELLNNNPDAYLNSNIEQFFQFLFEQDITTDTIKIISKVVGLAEIAIESEDLFHILLNLSIEVSNDIPLSKELKIPMTEIVGALNQAFLDINFEYDLQAYVLTCIRLSVPGDEELNDWTENLTNYLDLFENNEDLRAKCLDAIMYREDHIEFAVDVCKEIINSSINEQVIVLWILYNISGRYDVDIPDPILFDNVLCYANNISFQILNSNYNPDLIPVISEYLQQNNFVFTITIANELINCEEESYFQLIPLTIQAVSKLISEDNDETALNLIVTIHLLIEVNLDILSGIINELIEFIHELIRIFHGNNYLFEEIVSIIKGAPVCTFI